MSYFDDIAVLPYPHRLRASRSRRRFSVALHVSTTLALAVLLWIVTLPDPGPVRSMLQAVAFLLLLGAWFALHTQLARATDTMAGYGDLDERQRAQLDRATRIGHNVTSALILAALFTAAAVVFLSVAFPSALAMPALFVVYMTHASLPLLYLAWTQPEEFPEDEEEAPGNEEA